MLKHYNIKVLGVVQGVFFRKFSQIKAEELGVNGFVENREDFVYIEAEAEEEQLKAFVKWCHDGPEEAVVEKVTLEEAEIKGYDMFEVRRH